MQHRTWIAIALVAATIIGWAVAPPAATAAGATVRITSGLDPATTTVAPGDSVTWRNDDTQRHRIRSTAGPVSFDSGDLDPGESFTLTLSLEGTYAYRDERNKDASAWWGSITVSSAPVASPSPGPTPLPGASPTPTPPPAPVQVGMAGRAFAPASITIPTGGQVTWRNNDTRDHTVTANGAFDSGVMPVGATYARTFTSPGSFSYLCLIHPDMTGTVTVTGAAVPPPPGATPTPTPIVTPTPPAPPAGAVNVAAVDLAFQPATYTVDAGATVVFANRGQAAHTVTARDGSFGSPLLLPGASWQQAFTTPGTYAYLCTLHPGMAGAIVVRGAGGAVPPTPDPTPTPSPVPDHVAMLDFSFGPPSVTVPTGTTVTWTNVGVAPHTATQTGGGFNSGFIQPGGTWAWTFAAPGTYEYICAIHPQMTGVVRVTAGAPPAGGAGAADGQAGAGAGAGAGTPGGSAGGPAPGAAASGEPAGGRGGAELGERGGAPGDALGPADPGASAAAAAQRSPLMALLAGVLITAALGAGLWVVRDVGRRADAAPGG